MVLKDLKTPDLAAKIVDLRRACSGDTIVVEAAFVIQSLVDARRMSSAWRRIDLEKWEEWEGEGGCNDGRRTDLQKFAGKLLLTIKHTN